MTVAELIDQLCRVEDRSLPVICGGKTVTLVYVQKVKEVSNPDYGPEWKWDAEKGTPGVVLE